MKRIKKAFTLAEILITLGIIAVVAALTTPALIQHAASAKIGPAISRTVSVLSQGFEAYLYDNGTDTVFSANPSIGKQPVEIFKKLETNVKMELDGSSSPAIKESVTGGDVIASGGGSLFVFTDKSAIIVPPEECNPNPAGFDAELPQCPFYFLPMGWMNKDILLIGEDAFELAYNNKGHILIYGLDYGTLWTESCNDTQVQSFTPNSNKHSCGGRIAAYGFKKDY